MLLGVTLSRPSLPGLGGVGEGKGGWVGTDSETPVVHRTTPCHGVLGKSPPFGETKRSPGSRKDPIRPRVRKTET